MKKRLGIVLTAVLTLAMSTTVFAADSPTKGVVVVEKTNNEDGSKTTVAKNEDGSKVTATSTTGVTVGSGDVTMSFADESGNKLGDVKVTIKSVAEEEKKAFVEKAAAKAKDAADVKMSNILAAIDVKIENFTTGKASLPLTVSGVRKGDSVYAIHVLANGDIEFLDAVAEADGVVTVKTTSFSPIIIMKGVKPELAGTGETGNSSGGANTGNEIKAPQMGETHMSVFIMLLAAVALTGGAFCTKKLTANR